VRKRGKRDGRMMYEGRIVEIIERGQSWYVGELCREFKRWFVRPDGDILHAPVFVGDPGAKRAHSGDQVVVEIIDYPSRGCAAPGTQIGNWHEVAEPVSSRGAAGTPRSSQKQQTQHQHRHHHAQQPEVVQDSLHRGLALHLAVEQGKRRRRCNHGSGWARRL
jgi:exoribonuclease R